MQKKTLLLVVLVLLLSLVVVTSGVLANDSVTGARGGTADSTPPQLDPDDLTEGFDDITNLPGWFMQNNSSPIGTTGWFQGNSAVFPAHAGAATAYIGANFNNTAGTGTISNWLLTPVLNLNDGDTISFWTRTATGTLWADRLELRMSTNGASTNVGTLATDVGDFTTLLLSVNPNLVVSEYPQVWTEYTATISGVPTPTDGRLAFRYFVTNGGPSGANSNYIGIDTFVFTDVTVAEPDIAISKSPDTQDVTEGGNANFTIVVTNTGTVTLTNVTVADALAPDCDNALGTLSPSEVASYSCTDIGVMTSYTNTAEVTSIYDSVPGPSASDDAYVNVTAPTSVSLSDFSSSGKDYMPVWLGALMLIIAGLGVGVYRRRTAA